MTDNAHTSLVTADSANSSSDGEGKKEKKRGAGNQESPGQEGTTKGSRGPKRHVRGGAPSHTCPLPAARRGPFPVVRCGSPRETGTNGYGGWRRLPRPLVAAFFFGCGFDFALPRARNGGGGGGGGGGGAPGYCMK